MKVRELREKLKSMPQDAEVVHIWDGAARTYIEVVYLANNGDVATADFRQVVYEDEDRPIGAPTTKDVLHWRTPSKQITPI